MSRATPAALAVVGLVASACSSNARRGEPIAGAFSAHSDAELSGREVFMRECHQCHPGGMAGLGPAINDKPLPGWLVKFQVRNGLGAMPSFDERTITDAELDDLVAYLRALREHGTRGG